MSRRLIFMMVASLAAATGLALASTRPTIVNVARVQYGAHSGKVLVDSKGRGLYMFSRDTSTTSKCTGSCTLTFKPLPTSGKVKAENGVNSKLIGTIHRKGWHQRQVTYNGHPLYVATTDSAGYSTQEGCKHFHGWWHLVNTKGNAVKSPGACQGY
jgi:predicted lipoprotein with Yx(FWY)xxD motif